MSCETSVKVPVCGLEFALDTSSIGTGMSKNEVQAMIDEAKSDGGLGEYQGVHKQSGWQELPGGLIIQWGMKDMSKTRDTVTFPKPFPNNVFNIQLTDRTLPENSVSHIRSFGVILEPNLYGMTILTSDTNDQCYWLAIGN